MDPDSGKVGKAEKSITSPNRFEKLENLDPDVEDSVLEPSSSSETLKGSSRSSSKSADTDRKRDRDKSSASSSGSNYRGRKGNVVQHHRGVKGHSSEPETVGKSEGSSRTTGKNGHENELQTAKDSKNLENDSEWDDSRGTDTSNYKNASSSTSGIEAGPSHESLSGTEEQLDLSQDSLQQQAGKKRTSYSRVSCGQVGGRGSGKLYQFCKGKTQSNGGGRGIPRLPLFSKYLVYSYIMLIHHNIYYINRRYVGI